MLTVRPVAGFLIVEDFKKGIVPDISQKKLWEVDENNVPYFGEVNTLPGFTNISLYPQLWAVSGINYKALIDELIRLAIAEFDDNAKLH